MFKDKTLLITVGTGSYGNAVLDRFLELDNSNTILKLIQSYTPIIYRETWRKQ